MENRNLQNLKSLLNMQRKDETLLYQEIKNEFLSQDNDFFAGDLLVNALKKYPHHIALECQDQKITYKELYFRAMQLSRKYQEQGITEKDHVMVYFENSIEFYIGYYAAWLAAHNPYISACIIMGGIESALLPDTDPETMWSFDKSALTWDKEYLSDIAKSVRRLVS